MAGFGGRFGHSKAQAALCARCSSTGMLQKGLQCIACPTIRATPDHNKGLLLVFLVDLIQDGGEAEIGRLVKSGQTFLVFSLFSSEADLIHDAFSVFPSAMLEFGDDGTDDGPYSL